MNPQVFRIGLALLLSMVTPGVAAWAETTPDMLCNGRKLDDWLVGRWEVGEAAEVIFLRRDEEIMWSYTRMAEIMPQRGGGRRQPATAEGEVHVVTNCAIELRGAYTSYGGADARRVVGTALNYDLIYDGRDELKGTGIGWSKKTFQMRLRKRKLPELQSA